MRDPYEVLGVERSATETELKAAFRRAAARHHPDRNPEDPGAQERFTEVNGAYQLLSDPEKRAAFDRYGEAAFQTGGGGAATYTNVPVDFSNLDGLFGDLFGALGFNTARSRTLLHQTLRLSFEEAALGCTKELAYQAIDLCEACGGRGAEPGTKLRRCAACGGAGRIRLARGGFFLNMQRPCPSCAGIGRIPAVACGHCAGKGLAPREHAVDIHVPPGVESGATQTIAGAGHRVNPDRPPGNLEVVVEVASHGEFTRVGESIQSVVPVDFVTATLGGQIEVATLHGRSTLKVPPGTVQGELLRIRGAGIPRRRGGFGEHVVTVELRVPTSVSPRARSLIIDFESELDEEERRRSRGVMSKLRGWFG